MLFRAGHSPSHMLFHSHFDNNANKHTTRLALIQIYFKPSLPVCLFEREKQIQKNPTLIQKLIQFNLETGHSGFSRTTYLTVRS